MDWHIGQKVTVISRHRYSTDQDGTITKIARKYLTVTIDGRHDTFEFDIATGLARSNGYPSSTRIVTPEILAEERKRAALWARLRERGLDRCMGSQLDRTLATDKLAAIVAILEES